MSFVTKVGSTAEFDPGSADALLAVEPETGATLRTKGRLYALCEVLPPARSGAALTREIVELVRQEYYYDLSAGVEVSLRRAARQANRRGAQLLRGAHGKLALHLACVVVVNNELHAVRIGGTQVFLVRRARLFLPGEEPGDLADFVHRTTTRRAASLGAEPDLLPAVWRQAVESGDTVIVAASALVEALGAEELKSAAVTLHPRSAAEHVHNRAVADGVGGGASALFVEIAAAPSAATRVVAPTELTRLSDEVVLAETIRSRVDRVARRMPHFGALPARALAPAGRLGGRILRVALELMPHREVSLPRPPDVGRERTHRQHRAAAAVATAAIVSGVALGTLAYQDYVRGRGIGEYAAAFGDAQAEVAAARRAIERVPRDAETARDRLEVASARLSAAAGSPVADPRRISVLAAEIDHLRDLLANVLVDLGRVAAAARPVQLAQTVNGLYAADPGAGRLWRLYGDPVTTGVVIERGTGGASAPVAVLVATGEALTALDDGRKVWRAEGSTVLDVTPPDASRWVTITGAALFSGNLYVLDERSGQVWKHEGDDAGRFGVGIAFLAQPLAPGARSVAVDGGVWVVDRNGELLRYRRNPAAATAQRVDLFIRWQGEAVRATAVQALEAQRSIYLLDAPGRRVVQLTRDGRETARVALPATLEEPSAFYVSEVQRRVYAAHGGKISVTELK
ncbi:MAG: hypothetical protein Q7S25_03850 [Candidatus Limnocylindria bacterium]|nr:hypothetical protein [Candidatus Limnocylindria bacterium]